MVALEDESLNKKKWGKAQAGPQQKALEEQLQPVSSDTLQKRQGLEDAPKVVVNVPIPLLGTLVLLLDTFWYIGAFTPIRAPSRLLESTWTDQWLKSPGL